MSKQAANVVRIDRSSPKDSAQDAELSSCSVFEAPKMPVFLKGEAKAHWIELVESLGRKHRIINDLDADILSMYCTTYARWLRSDNELGESSMTQLSPNGYAQLSPEYIIWRDLTAQCLKIAKQLGLTPPARIQLKIGAPDGQDKFDF